MKLYRMHGLSVLSEIPLHHAEGDAGCPPDVVVKLGARRDFPDEPPAGELIASLVDSAEGRHYYSVVRTHDGGVTLRCFGLVEISVDRSQRDVVVHPAPDTEHEMLPVILGGLLIATLLQLRGDTVLHASAVAYGGAAVAFVGPSGTGKSTLSALLCTVGGSLMTDDVLRVDMRPPISVHPGSPECRLRETAQRLLPAASLLAGRRTGDGRLAVTTRERRDEILPLKRILLPRPSREVHSIAVTPVEPMAAAHALLASPRISGWTEPGSTMRYFESVTSLVERVPVGVVTVPWDQPFTEDVAAELLGAVFA